MNFTLKTSKYTKEILQQLQAATGITPNILIRYAVALSLKNPEKVSPIVKDPPDGLVLNRSTVTGEYDYVFHALIAQHSQTAISDTEYFPSYFNAHLERGIRLLGAEYKSTGNYEKFIRSLIS